MKKMLSLMAMFLGIILMQSFSVPEAKAANCGGISPEIWVNGGSYTNPVYTLVAKDLLGLDDRLVASALSSGEIVEIRDGNDEA